MMRLRPELQIGHQIEPQIGPQIGSQIRPQIEPQIETQTGPQISSQIIGSKIYLPVGSFSMNSTLRTILTTGFCLR